MAEERVFWSYQIVVKVSLVAAVRALLIYFLHRRLCAVEVEEVAAMIRYRGVAEVKATATAPSTQVSAAIEQ